MAFILCCTKRGNLRKVMGAGHCFKIEHDSALGAALHKTRKEGGPYVTVDALPQFQRPDTVGPFKHLKLHESPDSLHPLLNCGKEWIFRTIFSTGQEVISEGTGATFQSFQTRLRLNKLGFFDIITHVSACKNNECFSFNVVNHFALVPEGDRHIGDDMNIMSVKEAAEDFRKDMRWAMKTVNGGDSRFSVRRTPEFKADDFYGAMSTRQPMVDRRMPPPRFPGEAMGIVLDRGFYG